MEYSNYTFDDIVFAILMYVDQNEQFDIKNSKVDKLINILLSRQEKYSFFDTYDEYYEDVDEQLQENNDNFFEEIYAEQDERFTCYGVLDDDDLTDYDNLSKSDDLLQECDLI